MREEQEEVVPLAASKEEDLDYKPEEEEEPGRLTEKQVGDPPRRRNQGDSASEISSEEEEVPHPRKFSKGLGGHHPYFRKGREQLGKSVPKEKKGVENRDRFDVRRIKWESLDWLKSMIKENSDWAKAELSTPYAHDLQYMGSEWERKIDGNEDDSNMEDKSVDKNWEDHEKPEEAWTDLVIMDGKYDRSDDYPDPVEFHLCRERWWTDVMAKALQKNELLWYLFTRKLLSYWSRMKCACLMIMSYSLRWILIGCVGY